MSTGFTLLEMLAVVAIVAILVGILVPVIAKQKIKAKATLARTDCSAIANAITQYHMDNSSRFPLLSRRKAGDRYDGGMTRGGDITFSLHDNSPIGRKPFTSDMMIILSGLDIPSADGQKINPGNALGGSKGAYLKSELTNDREKEGLGPDGIYRDPFGNPYVVTVDKSGDDRCWDMFYGAKEVSGTGPDQKLDGGADDMPAIGQHGLMKVVNGANVGYVLQGKAMVWSAGPDREISPGAGALMDKNYDNIIGW
tara:strand:- start:3138 stop:3899 length:762 start_codon:yes stop_codon:yes gene_type:complete